MIIFDTNVLSEPFRPKPEIAVIEWISGLDREDGGWTTAITVGELLSGVQRLPSGKRRDRISAGAERVIRDFADRVLSYDVEAARQFASIREERRSAGQPISTEDGMIAAICLREGATLATRNTKDFEHLGLDLIDPWSL